MALAQGMSHVHYKLVFINGVTITRVHCTVIIM